MRLERAALGALAFIILVLGACLYEVDRRGRSQYRTFTSEIARLGDQLAALRIQDAAMMARLSADNATANARLSLLESIPLRPIVSTLAADAFNNTDGRTSVPCAQQGRTAVILIAGQSNAANMGIGPHHVAEPSVLNYNLFDGRCYRAQDPLLGTSHTGNNFATLMGDMLIERGYDTVILIPVAVASTRIEQWVPGGVHYPRLTAAVTHLYYMKLLPTVVLWQQGEGNFSADPRDGERYKNALRTLVAALRGHWVDAPFIVAQGTRCGGGPSEVIRNAQREAVDQAQGIFAGPDTDQLDGRYDGCHFDPSAVRIQAAMWTDAIVRIGSAH